MARSRTVRTRQAPPVDRQVSGYTVGASVQGGGRELLDADGSVLTAKARDDNGSLTLYLLVRGLDKYRTRGALRITYRRVGQSMNAGATETLELYNFDSGSYPYGTFTVAYTGSVPDAFQTVSVALPGNASQYISYEGDLFVRIRVPEAGASGQLLIDQLRIEWDE